MFRYGRTARTTRGVMLAPDHTACDAVCDAEGIVRRAWEAVLLDRARRMAELDLLARTAEDHARGALTDPPAPVAVRMTAQPAEAAALPATPAAGSAPPSCLRRGPARWIRRLLRARAVTR